MNDRQQELYVRIEQFSFDEGDEELAFASRLARENGWSTAFTRRVIDEYKKFMFLAVVAGHPVTPSDQVDQVWHLHLAYTKSYWERWCGDVLGRPVHHGPTKGGREEARKYHDWYEKTRGSYRKFFGTPPEDIWPDSSIRFGDDLHFQRVNVAKNWVIPKPRLRSRAVLAAFVLPVATAVGGVSLFGDGGFTQLVVGLVGIALAGYLVWSIVRSIVGRGGGSGGIGGCAVGCSRDGCSGDGCGGGGCSGGGCGGCGGCGGGGCGGA